MVEALPPDAVHARISDDLDRYRDRLMTLWCNAGGRDIAPWLRGLTEQVLVTPQCFSDWEGEVSERALRSRVQKEIQTGRNRHIRNWTPEYVEEFIALVREMKSQGFGRSADVSKYIVKNRLGEKYKNISGWLDFEAGGDKWTFKGGIAPHVYGMLCTELGLADNRSGARPTEFVPFRDRPA
ncbi:hypothetical protein N8556_00250 [bacterium]|nr:hypothetical protein [bacterium]